MEKTFKELAKKCNKIENISYYIFASSEHYGYSNNN